MKYFLFTLVAFAVSLIFAVNADAKYIYGLNHADCEIIYEGIWDKTDDSCYVETTSGASGGLSQTTATPGDPVEGVDVSPPSIGTKKPTSSSTPKD